MCDQQVLQSEGFDGSLRDPCEYCDNGSLMLVSQRDKAHSLDSTVCATGGCDLVNLDVRAMVSPMFCQTCWCEGAARHCV